MTIDTRGPSAGVLLITVMATAIVSSASAQTTPSPVPFDADIRKILADRVDTYHQSVGIVVGVLEPSGRRIVSYGRRAKDDNKPLDGETIFEIGSMTKVFTSLLLADTVGRGEVALSDPVGKFLPSTVKVPERGGRSITLQDLATHTSGLPRLPSNFVPKDPGNPYADYSVEQLDEFLSGYQLTRDIGAQYEYSNLGVGLLGHALARRTGMDYEALVRARVTGPLGMRHTSIALSSRHASAACAGSQPGPGAGPELGLADAGRCRCVALQRQRHAHVSGRGDRRSILAARPRLRDDARHTTADVLAGDGSGARLAQKESSTEVIWHNGGTGGYRTWMGYEPRSRTGVVVLTNAGTAAGPDDIGRHLLVPSAPLLQDFPAQTPPQSRTETKIEPSFFDRYVGRYQFAPSVFITVTREGDRFLAQLTGQPAFQIFAEAEDRFFLKVVDAQLTFEMDAQRKAIAVVLHQNGIDQRAPRIEGEPVAPKEIALETDVLNRYVGEYQVVPGAVITISQREGRLFAQLTGQGPAEIFASSEREFFYKVVNAQITFEIDPQGRATALVLHQLGRDTRAPRNP